MSQVLLWKGVGDGVKGEFACGAWGKWKVRPISLLRYCTATFTSPYNRILGARGSCHPRSKAQTSAQGTNMLGIHFIHTAVLPSSLMPNMSMIYASNERITCVGQHYSN